MENPTSKKLLTIAIPTWNRANYLKELLEKVTFQISDSQLENQIELLISNNNSEDSTEEIINTFRNKFSFITYNKNSINIGAKSNVIKSMELASGEFVMILGDDDRIRKDCLKDIIQKLISFKNVGVLIDTSISKVKNEFSEGEISLKTLIENFYWYIGNAGLFIMRTQFIKDLRKNNDYEFFNECWPQTQTIIIGITNQPEYKCYLSNLTIHSKSVHGEVMIYNSFYLWRTCYFELTNAINNIRTFITGETYFAAKHYLEKNIFQQVFNILQCGVFVDDVATRKKTVKHIYQNLNLFSLYEKIFLWIIIIVLSLPTWISKPFANIFIFCLKGKHGLKKKNDFVEEERSKKVEQRENNESIRTLEFEK